MAIHNREAFLDNLAEQLGRTRRTKVESPVYSVHPQERVFQDATQGELVEKLEEQCKVIHTSFTSTKLETLGETLRTVLNDYGVTKVVGAAGPRNDATHLSTVYAELQSEGYDIHLWDENKGRENVTFAEQAGAGIVFSDITLAESGTVTLFNDRYNGRSISLLPETFIAIVPKSTLVPRMTQASQLIHEEEKKGNPVSSCVSFVTGPSNSADIEMNLIVGVHGPVKATYILVDDL
ncbi:lactate utilization protein C [Alkalihalobacillus hwajinpoensis]|uniref:LutC/YkgG family protein n=1 Tax=Guptibacillus hwajinpoensis TaxID=208199 RepID=UPI001883193A|nr:lactate utilization protein C [Pseudalkalibacillus hwajinpoensis]MBF0709443.1 lactate utilization protein C [Pseudalkalibacillus hwajinpoensis]